MGDKDIISKDIFKRLALDIARILLHLQVDSAKIIGIEYPCIEVRRADLVVLMSGIAGEFIQHVEIQNDNDPAMPVRMLRYRTDIQQHLLYIGRAALIMQDGLKQTGLDYRYRIVAYAHSRLPDAAGARQSGRAGAGDPVRFQAATGRRSCTFHPAPTHRRQREPLALRASAASTGL